MQDPLIKNHRCDINGNEKEVYKNHNSKGSNHRVNVKSDSSYFSKQHPSAAKAYLSEAGLKNISIKGSTELKNTSIKDSRDDTRKLSPLRISKSRIFFWNDQKDDDKTPEYPLKEDDAFFKTLSHSNETLCTQVNAKPDEQNRNLFKDVSTSVPVAISPGDQAKTPQYADVYQNGKFEEKHQTITTNVAETSFQENRSLNENILQIQKSDSSKPKVLGSCLKPETHASFLEATSNNDHESKKKTSTAKIMYKNEKFHDNKEDGQQNNERIPLLSPIDVHNEDKHTLFSPQYSLQPPTLIPISNDNLDVKSNKKGEGKNFSSQIKLSSKCKIHSNHKLSTQEQKSSISSSDLDSLKYSPQNNCQTIKSESNNSEKESKVQSHSAFDNKVLEISEQQETLNAFVEEKSCLSLITLCVGDGNSMVRDSPHNSTNCELVKSCCDANSKSESTQNCNEGCVYSSTSHTNTENCESGIFLDYSNHHGSNSSDKIICSNGADNADLKTESRIENADQSQYQVPVKTDSSLHPDKQTTNLDVQCGAVGHAGGGHAQSQCISNSHNEFPSTLNSYSELPSTSECEFASHIELPTTELISTSKSELTLCSNLTSTTHSEQSTSKTKPNSITKPVLENTAQKSQVNKTLLNVPGDCLLSENMINECTDNKPAAFSFNIDDGLIQNKDVSCTALSIDQEPGMKSCLLDKQLVSKCPMASTMNMDSSSKECFGETATEQILIHLSERISKNSTSSDDIRNKATRKCQSSFTENHSKNDTPNALLYSLTTAAQSKTTEQPAAQSVITEQLTVQPNTTEQLTLQSMTTEQLAVQSKTMEQLAPALLNETSTDKQEGTAFEKSSLCVKNIRDSGSEYNALICDKTMTPLSKHQVETTHSDITNKKTGSVEITEKCSNGSDKTNEKYLTRENGLAGTNSGFSKHLILPSKEAVKIRRRKSGSSESFISSCDKKVDSVTLILHEHETSRKKLKMEAHSNDTVTPSKISCGDSMDYDFKFSPEKKTLYSPLQNYQTANVEKVLHFADRGHRENDLVIHNENLAISQPNNEEQLTAMSVYEAQYDLNSQRNASTISENFNDRKNLTRSVLPKIISEDNAILEQCLSSSASTTLPSQTTDKSKGNTELSNELVIHLHKLSNHQEGISEATDLPLSLAKNKNTDIHSSGKPHSLLSQKGLNMPEKWATQGSLSVQGSAAKSMKLNIIQRMAERSTGNKKRTDRKCGKLNHFKNTSDQPKVTFSNTTYAEVKNNEVKNDGEGHHTHEQIDTSDHLANQRFQHKQAAARDSMSLNASMQSEATGQWLDVQTSKSTHSQYSALQEAHPDPLWANMPHRPHFMGETSIRNAMLPAITPPTPFNRSAIISSPQQIIKFGPQPAFNRSSLHTVQPLSAEQMKLCRQLHPSQLKPTQQETIPEETCRYPSQVQIPFEASYNPRRASTEVSNERTTKIPGSHDLYHAYNQNWQHNEIQASGQGSSTNPQLDYSHTDNTSQYLLAPYPHLFWSGQSPDLQTPSHSNKYRLSVKENTTAACYDDQNIQDKPLDLSKNIETQINNCTDTQLLLLSSHVQFQEGVDRSNFPPANLKSHDRDHHTQPAKLPNYFSLPCPTSNQLSLQIQDDGYSKGQPTLNKTSLSWSKVTSINSPSATQHTLKPDVICDDGLCLEATLQHKFVTDNINNHSFEKLDKISSKPQMIHFYMDNPLHSSNNGNISVASDKILAQSVCSTPETSRACPVSNSSKLLFDFQIPVVTSAELISPLISHNQETQLAAVLPSQEITRHALSREKSGSLSMTPSLNGYSGSPDSQQRTNSQNSNDSRLSSTLSDNTGNVKSVSPRVVPLPVKDFFTSSSRENTYSSLLMAKITSQHKKPTNLQKGNELFLNNEPQRTSSSCVFEIGNNHQRNFVIDLTAGDDDCSKLNITSKENELRDETSRNKVLVSASEDFSRVNKINRYSSLQQLDKISHEAISKETSHYNREVHNLENQSSKESNGSSEFSLPVRHWENFHILEKQFLQHSCVDDDAVSYNSMSNPGEISKVCTQNIMPQANLQTYFSYQSNEFSDKKTDHSLKIAPKRKEIMARKVKTAVETWPPSVRQEEISLSSPLMNENNVRTSLRTGYINSSELTQADTNQLPAHDNSTQRAAATLLELSANPVYNSNLLLPETSDDYQEKVYQIHHKLNVDDYGKKYPAQNERHNINIRRFGLIDSREITQTAANKSGPRTHRRVGRPPKDQYVSSASSAGEVNLLNSAISKEAAISSVTLPLMSASIIYSKPSHSIPYNPPLSVFSSKVFCEPHLKSQATTPVMLPPVVIEPGSQTSCLAQTNSIQGQQPMTVVQQSRAAVTTTELLKHLTDDPASHTFASVVSNKSTESSRNCLELTNEDNTQIKTQQTVDKFVGHPATSYCISSIGSHISTSDTLISTSAVHNKIPGHQTSHDADLDSKKHCLDVVCKMSLNTNTTFSHLVQPSVESLILENNSQTLTDPSTYAKKPASNADSLQVSCSTHSHAKNRISDVVPCISAESFSLPNKLNIVSDKPFDQTSACRRLILKRKTMRRHKQIHLQPYLNEESKLLCVAAPYNEHDQEAGTAKDTPPSRLHINMTETNEKHNGVSCSMQVENDSLHEERNMKKRKSKLQHSKITRKRKKASVHTSNEMYPAQEKNERCEEIACCTDKTINESMQHVHVPEEVCGDLAVKDKDFTMKLTSYGDQILNASHNGEQEDHMPCAGTTTEVIIKHKRYETVSSSANINSKESDSRQAEQIVARRGVTNSEANVSEKEKEVTSLLAALMYNKLKGRIN